MARSNAAQNRPPVRELPSTPAGAYEDVGELLGVVVEHERRRGRGAQSNASGRYEPLARVAFDDGWRTLDELPPFKTTVSVDSVREYAPGDPFKAIHWPTSARRDDLFVRQFEHTPTSDWWVFLDLQAEAQAGSGTASTLEHGIILAASLVDRGIRQGLAVGGSFAAVLDVTQQDIRTQVSALVDAYSHLFLPPAPYYSVLMDGCLENGRGNPGCAANRYFHVGGWPIRGQGWHL